MAGGAGLHARRQPRPGGRQQEEGPPARILAQITQQRQRGEIHSRQTVNKAAVPKNSRKIVMGTI